MLFLVASLSAVADPIIIDGTLTEGEWGPEAVGEVPTPSRLFPAGEDKLLNLGLRTERRPGEPPPVAG